MLRYPQEKSLASFATAGDSALRGQWALSPVASSIFNLWEIPNSIPSGDSFWVVLQMNMYCYKGT